MAQTEQEGISKNYEKALVVNASDSSRDIVTLWADKVTHRLLVDAGTITTSSASVGTTGAAVPSSADYVAGNKGGLLTGLLIGQQTMANSLAVTFASDQGAISVTTTPSLISTNNSSTATLLSGAAFTGTSEDVTSYSEMRVTVFSNVASATDGLSVQQSTDNTNWDVTDVYTISAGSAKTVVVPRQARYFRVVYTNGGTNQTSFRLQTVLNRTGTAPSSQRPNDAYTNETDLVQGQSFLMGYNGTTWDRIRTVGTGVLSSNITTINSVTPLMGNGVTGTGSQRVTIASDNTAFAVNATLSAETTKVIGTVNVAAAQTITVTQATGTNLHMVVDSGTVTTVSTVTNLSQMNGAALLMGNGVTGTGSQRVTMASDNTAIATWGQGATGSAVPSGATYKGVRGTTALPTAVTDGQMAGAMADKYGRQVALLGTIRDLVGTQTTTISASTSETTIVTAAASVFNDLMMLIVSNTSTATNTRIDFRDTTAGSVLFSLQSNGGQPPIGFALGGASIPQTSVNTNWTAQCATSTTDIRVYAVFAKNK